ncbi:MAG TPA: hypothetical protein VN419_04685, partial [Humidesulfovibrio sp.]|uniref:hypothetical protein n=1 Tax=Humidesulfovibrio sp. TaxID=2910988 RepID=UPI002B8F25B9
SPSGSVAGGTVDIGPVQDKYGEYDGFFSHQTWAGIYNGLYYGAKVADFAGTVASFFIPAGGAYTVVKVANTVGKGYAVTQDTEKQAFIKSVITGVGQAIQNAAARDTKTNRSHAPTATHWARMY